MNLAELEHDLAQNNQGTKELTDELYTLRSEQEILTVKTWVAGCVEYGHSCVYDDTNLRGRHASLIPKDMEIIDVYAFIPIVNNALVRDQAWFHPTNAVTQDTLRFMIKGQWGTHIHQINAKNPKSGLLTMDKFGDEIEECNGDLEQLKTHRDSIHNVYGKHTVLNKWDDCDVISRMGQVKVQFCCYIKKYSLSHAIVNWQMLRKVGKVNSQPV